MPDDFSPPAWITTAEAAECGSSGPVNLHSFRPAFVRDFLLDGGDLDALSDLMGHSDVSVTKAVTNSTRFLRRFVTRGGGSRGTLGPSRQGGSDVTRIVDPLLEEIRQTLLRMGSLAEAMDHNNALQKQLHPGITTENLERIESIARPRGAMAAMINGAGGGGSTTLLCRPGAKIEATAALREAGFQTLPFSLALKPAYAWIVSEED